jgi:hypothetical protein
MVAASATAILSDIIFSTSAISPAGAVKIAKTVKQTGLPTHR